MFPKSLRFYFLSGLLLLTPAILRAASHKAAEKIPAPSTGSLACQSLEFRPSENVIVAKGRVVMISSGTRLEADEITVHTSSRTAHAEGHVYLAEGGMWALADKADYDWEKSTGTLYNAYLVDPPWRFWGKTVTRLSPDRYRVERAAVTSCDLDPPHYHFRGHHGTYRPRKRATVYNGRLSVENDQVLYTPVYTRSLKDRRWTIRVDPGRSARDGYFVKTIFGYPITQNTYGRIYWDHFQRTGDGLGGEYSYFRPDVKGSLYTYRIKDHVSKTDRWNFRAGHWQRLSSRLALQANSVFQSDTDFNNHFFRDDFERVRQSAQSQLGLTYQHPFYSTRVSVEEDQILNPLKNRFVRQKTVLPRLNFQSSPLQLGASEIYATLTGNLRNEYDRPESKPPAADPIIPEKDIFRQTGDASLDFSRSFALTRNITLKPAVGYSEQWQSWRDVSSTTINQADFFQGRAFTRTNFRQRLTRSIDYDVSHVYRVRMTPNRFKRDHAAPGSRDRGTEENSLGLFASYRTETRFWARASSGYDLRILDGETIKTVRQKISPPNLEMNFTPVRVFTMNYRQTFLMFPVRQAQTTQFSVQAGRNEGLRFNSGLSYNVGNPGQVQVRHGAAFPLTRGWWLDGGVQYNAIGSGKLRYSSVKFIEKSLVVKRDLHCWRARAGVRQRPGVNGKKDVNEVFFRIDLKTNIEARREMASPDEQQFYPAREREVP